MPAAAPLSTLLSQVLVAHTMELDNDFEQRLAESGESARPTSVVMWSNVLRFVGDGIMVGDLPDAAALPEKRVLSNLGGMERWRYIFVAPAERAANEKRDGWGSARGLRSDWIVRPTPAGRATQEIRPALFGEIEERWEKRFGVDRLGDLRSSLRAIVSRLDIELPEYVPIVAGADGMVAGVAPRPRSQTPTPSQLTALLAQALLAYTLDFEARSELSLALSANVVRAVGEAGTPVRDIPAATGISKEGTSIALRFLGKTGYTSIEGSTAATRHARFTTKGRKARARMPHLHSEVEAAWGTRFGVDEVRILRTALDGILEHPSLAEGLRPHADAWRASKAYRARTDVLLENPRAALPHYPLVLHRGGWPDGS